MANSNDYACVSAALALQLQDIQDLRHSDVGDEDADQTLALQAYQDELERSVLTLRDHRVATLLDGMPQQDQHLPAVPPPLMPIADLIECLHRPFCSITNSQDTTEQHRVQTMEFPKERPTKSDDSRSWISKIFGEKRHDNERNTSNPNLIARAGVFFLYAFRHRPWGDIPHVDGESDSRKLESGSEEHHRLYAHRDALSESPESSLSCSICRYVVSLENSLLLPCQDRYCDECIVCLFNAAMKHESSFPPKCCGEQVPLAMVQHLLPADFEEAFNMRQLELGTPNRTYCSNNDCSAFIDPWYHVCDTAACPKCYSYTCIFCKGSAHDDECPEDPAIIGLMATAASKGYKQCP